MKLIKIINLIILITLLLSCNSNSKTTDFYGKKTGPMQTSIERGKAVYSKFCITCHMADGKGVEKIFPPLANSDYLRNYPLESIRSVKYGMSGEVTVNGVTYNSVMAPMGLSDKEVADVMNYINNSWGNKSDEIITEEQVSKIQRP